MPEPVMPGYAAIDDGGDVDVAPDPGAMTPTRRLGGALGLGFWLSVGWLVAIATAAVFADALPFVGDPDSPIRDVARKSGPSLEYPFGVDSNKFDVFARSIYGARVSLMVGFATILVGFVVGGGLGLLAGYFRGRLETGLVAGADAMLAFPQLVAALAIVAFLGASVVNLILALSLLAVPALFRVTRAATLAMAERDFVTAARMVGATHRRILWREILPNVVPPMLSFGLLAVAIVIVGEGALAFLGLSVSAPTPSWGALIERGRDSLGDAAHISLGPAFMMFLTLVALNHVGDRLSRRFDIREAAM